MVDPEDQPQSPVEAIINGSAGSTRDDKAREELSRSLANAMPGINITFAEGARLGELAEAAKARGCKMLIAGGGDGTVSSIAAKVAGTGIVLGVLPLGTLNHFAKDLGVSTLQDALQALTHGVVKEVDVAEVNGRIFVNNSGLGLYPKIVLQRERLQRKGLAKWPAALWAAIRALARYRALTVRLQVEGKEQTPLRRRTPMVFVGNNQYQMEGLKAGTRSRLDAGELCIYLPLATSRLKLLRMSVSALLGKLHRSEDFEALLARELHIETRRQRSLHVTLDGEVTAMNSPLHYKIRSKALRVMLPAEKR